MVVRNLGARGDHHRRSNDGFGDRNQGVVRWALDGEDIARKVCADEKQRSKETRSSRGGPHLIIELC